MDGGVHVGSVCARATGWLSGATEHFTRTAHSLDTGQDALVHVGMQLQQDMLTVGMASHARNVAVDSGQ